MRQLITFILALFLCWGCSSLSDLIVPELSKRTLRISVKVPGFEYQYEVCVKHFLGMCAKKQWQIDYYDLTNQDTKKQLMDMGFVAKVREKIIP